jgi:ABC-type uncharacterized transport system YnjBCD ATPase subunit
MLMNTGLELQDVSLSVGSRQLLSLSCTIAPGEVMTVMGASGTGKSTLLAFIAGFLNEAFTAEGRIVLENKASPKTLSLVWFAQQAKAEKTETAA